jgi:hypothetical protein
MRSAARIVARAVTIARARGVSAGRMSVTLGARPKRAMADKPKIIAEVKDLFTVRNKPN